MRIAHWLLLVGSAKCISFSSEEEEAEMQDWSCHFIGRRLAKTVDSHCALDHCSGLVVHEGMVISTEWGFDGTRISCSQAVHLAEIIGQELMGKLPVKPGTVEENWEWLEEHIKTLDEYFMNFNAMHQLPSERVLRAMVFFDQLMAVMCFESRELHDVYTDRRMTSLMASVGTTVGDALTIPRHADRELLTIYHFIMDMASWMNIPSVHPRDLEDAGILTVMSLPRYRDSHAGECLFGAAVRLAMTCETTERAIDMVDLLDRFGKSLRVSPKGLEPLSTDPDQQNFARFLLWLSFNEFEAAESLIAEQVKVHICPHVAKLPWYVQEAPLGWKRAVVTLIEICKDSPWQSKLVSASRIIRKLSLSPPGTRSGVTVQISKKVEDCFKSRTEKKPLHEVYYRIESDVELAEMVIGIANADEALLVMHAAHKKLVEKQIPNMPLLVIRKAYSLMFGGRSAPRILDLYTGYYPNIHLEMLGRAFAIAFTNGFMAESIAELQLDTQTKMDLYMYPTGCEAVNYCFNLRAIREGITSVLGPVGLHVLTRDQWARYVSP